MVWPLLGVPLGFLMGPLLGVPLGFLRAPLKCFCGLLRDQRIFQEGCLGLHLCCYFHFHYHYPAHRRLAPLLWCHLHGRKNQNLYCWKSGEQTAVYRRQLYTLHGECLNTLDNPGWNWDFLYFLLAYNHLPHI